MARIETGTLSVSPEPTEVARLVDDARNSFVNGGGLHTIHMDIAPDLPRVMADRGRIVQVLTNLLTNAANHSETASAIRVMAIGEDQQVAIAVADDGQGVSTERLPDLFRKFSRINEEAGRNIDGTGLGLSICKGIVEAHGGRITAESGGLGQGTQLTFTLPVADETQPAHSNQVRPAGHQSRRNRSPIPILTVDDDPQTLRYVRATLSDAGYAPLVTADPKEMFELIETQRPRLILLDLMLRNHDGIELLEPIQEITDVPVIFISGYGRDQIIAKALDLGAADYVVKPFSPTELVARIRSVLRWGTRGARSNELETFQLDALTIDYAERDVSLRGESVALTAKEYDLLYELSLNPGRVLTHEQLLRRVWGPGYTDDPRSLRSVMRRLRRKLEDSADSPSYIFTVPRVGYRLRKPESENAKVV